MRNIAGYHLHLALRRLRYHPVLTAMMVYSVGFVVAALIAAFALWRATSSSPIPHKSELLYVVQIIAAGAGRSDASRLLAELQSTNPLPMVGAQLVVVHRFHGTRNRVGDAFIPFPPKHSVDKLRTFR